VDTSSKEVEIVAQPSAKKMLSGEVEAEICARKTDVFFNFLCQRKCDLKD
jgi:hypothetical protein